MAYYSDSDDDDDYAVFASKQNPNEEVVDKAINVALKRDGSDTYYGPWSVRWDLLCSPDGVPIASAEAKEDVQAMIDLITSHISRRGVYAVQLASNRRPEGGDFVSCALMPEAATSERRGESVVSRDVFSTVAPTPIAALADLASQMDDAYKKTWKTMRNGTFGISVLATYIGKKRSTKNDKKVGPAVLKYTLTVLRAAPTSASTSAVESRNKRMRLDHEIVKTVDEALKAAEKDK